MNLGAIRRQIARVEKRLAANGDGQQIPIARGGGMRALYEAIQRVRQDRLNAPPSPPVDYAERAVIAHGEAPRRYSGRAGASRRMDGGVAA